MTRQRGFIALYTLLTLAILLSVAVLVMAHWEGTLQIHRTRGGLAVAERAAHSVIQQQLAEDRVRLPRLWLPPLEGRTQLGEIRIHWRRRPVEGRWRAGARIWTPEWLQAFERLGGNRSAIQTWRNWLETRSLQRDPTLGLRGDLVTDPGFLRRIFLDLGLAQQGYAPSQMWTTDPGGSLGRLNLFGADPAVLARLSGVPVERITAFQTLASSGLADAASAQGYWRFDEWQALEPWVALRSFSEAYWEVEVKLPNLKAPITTRWRSSLDDGLPGNPWFRVRAWNPEPW